MNWMVCSSLHRLAVSTTSTAQGKFLPILVVCPLAVVDNWEREFQTWTPDLDVVVYKGSQVREEKQTGGNTIAPSPLFPYSCW